MNKLFLLALSFISCSIFPIFSQVTATGDLTRNGSLLTSVVNIDLSGIDVKSDQAVTFIPKLVNGNDTMPLNGLGIYGRTRWFQFERSGKRPLSGPDETSLRFHKDLGTITLNQNVPYEDWMNGCSLIIQRQDYGCAGCREGEPEFAYISGYTGEPEIENLIPNLIYVEAVEEEVKMREISGRAYVDFPVNQIIIYPDYRNNTYELGKIIATIDSVKNDKDITVTSLHIAGTASPEGPYENNVYLAKNRTKALKEYVQNLYKFPEGFITTSYEPVDWKGLREWLEANNIENKKEILSIVDSDLEPYARNSKIKKDFPVQYEWLLRNVYPALRHSDYIIKFNIRGYTDVSEIAEIIRTSPQKLSLAEMYRLASTLEPGSDEFNEVFEVAVRMYPTDEGANINAANSAMTRGDLKSAERYLERVGNSEKANHAREILKSLKEIKYKTTSRKKSTYI